MEENFKYLIGYQVEYKDYDGRVCHGKLRRIYKDHFRVDDVYGSSYLNVDTITPLLYSFIVFQDFTGRHNIKVGDLVNTRVNPYDVYIVTDIEGDTIYLDGKKSVLRSSAWQRVNIYICKISELKDGDLFFNKFGNKFEKYGSDIHEKEGHGIRGDTGHKEIACNFNKHNIKSISQSLLDTIYNYLKNYFPNYTPCVDGFRKAITNAIESDIEIDGNLDEKEHWDDLLDYSIMY